MPDDARYRYLYAVNYTDPEMELCRLEMKYLLGEEVRDKSFFSDVEVDPSRSPFIRHRLSVLHSAANLAELAALVRSGGNTFGEFEFSYFKFEGSELAYEEWRDRTAELERALGRDPLGGDPGGASDAGNPEKRPTRLGMAKKDGVWLFGEHVANDNLWKDHDRKPETNSHSLGLRTARALVNIAVGNGAPCSLVDPCCGVGTVLIEALSMGVAARGFEINRRIAGNAQANIAFFGLENAVTPGDMHRITEHFDVAVVDIPYGLFTPVTPGEQVAIIRTARRIADRMVIITFEDMDEAVLAAGFRIIDRCRVCKGRFVRYISVCE